MAAFSMFFNPMVLMFGLRYLFFKMKLDNSNAYEHDFLTRESALEFSETQNQAGRDNGIEQDISLTDGDITH